jgi:hypothetical protein
MGSTALIAPDYTIVCVRHTTCVMLSSGSTCDIPNRVNISCCRRYADPSAGRCSRTEHARFRAFRSSVCCCVSRILTERCAPCSRVFASWQCPSMLHWCHPAPKKDFYSSPNSSLPSVFIRFTRKFAQGFTVLYGPKSTMVALDYHRVAGYMANAVDLQSQAEVICSTRLVENLC